MSRRHHLAVLVAPDTAIDVLAGMPAVPDPHNIYSEAGAGELGPAAQASKAYAYVPNTKSGDVWVIDQQTFQVVGKFPMGKEVQHVVTSYDMSSLYATDDIGNVIRRIDPTTGQAGETIPVADPYTSTSPRTGNMRSRSRRPCAASSGTTR